MENNYYHVHLYFSEDHSVEVLIQAKNSTEIDDYFRRPPTTKKELLTYKPDSEYYDLVKRIVYLDKVLYIDIEKASEFEYESDEDKKKFNHLPSKGETESK